MEACEAAWLLGDFLVCADLGWAASRTLGAVSFEHSLEQNDRKASALNFSDVWGGGSQMPETGRAPSF